MYKLLITDSYRKKAKKFFKKRRSLLDQYEKFLDILCLNPEHPSLRLHKLKGSLKSLYSVSINVSYRLIVHFMIVDGLIMPVDIGSHEEVY